MERNIFCKKEQLNQFPPYFGHPLIPILFAENGYMPSSKNKPKKCLLVVNMAGIYFFRPYPGKHYQKISLFISTLNFTEIKYVDPKRRDIVSKSRLVYFSCDHADIAVAQLISLRKQIYQGMTDPIKYKLSNFPTTIQPEPYADEVLTNLHLLRYIIYSFRYGIQPMPSIINFFEQANPEFTKVAVFNEQCDPPPNLKSLVTPLVLLGSVTTIHFKGFAPYGACRFAHHFIKQSKNIRTIIFENYSELVPSQFRMNTLPTNTPLCLCFISCNFPDEIWAELFQEFTQYHGEIQRLTINLSNLTAKSHDALFACLKTARAFRTMEVLEIDQINCSAAKEENVNKSVFDALSHCRGVQRLSVSQWVSPIHLALTIFPNCQLLSELVLIKQDMTRQLPPDLPFPPRIKYINFSKCNFTITSLQSLFGILTNSRNMISLNLSDLNLPDNHWRQLMDDFMQISPGPVRCIREFNWSGNRLTIQACQAFCHFLFDTNPIQFLSLDRIFNPSKIDILQLLFSFIPRNRLLGISIGGSLENNFSGNFNTFLSNIRSLLPLHILHLDGQKMSESDSDMFVDFLRQNQCIAEVSCDNSSINAERKFYDFYNNLINLQNIKAVGRPVDDIARIYGSGLENLSRASSKSEFDLLRNRFAPIGRSTTQQIRANFLCTTDTTTRFNYADLAQYTRDYPLCYFNMEKIDYSLLDPKTDDTCKLSVTSDTPSSTKSTLAESQSKYLDNPLKNGENDLSQLFTKYRHTIIFDDIPTINDPSYRTHNAFERRDQKPSAMPIYTVDETTIHQKDTFATQMPRREAPPPPQPSAPVQPPQQAPPSSFNLTMPMMRDSQEDLSFPQINRQVQNPTLSPPPQINKPPPSPPPQVSRPPPMPPQVAKPPPHPPVSKISIPDVVIKDDETDDMPSLPQLSAILPPRQSPRKEEEKLEPEAIVQFNTTAAPPLLSSRFSQQSMFQSQTSTVHQTPVSTFQVPQDNLLKPISSPKPMHPRTYSSPIIPPALAAQAASMIQPQPPTSPSSRRPSNPPLPPISSPIAPQPVINTSPAPISAPPPPVVEAPPVTIIKATPAPSPPPPAPAQVPPQPIIQTTLIQSPPVAPPRPAPPPPPKVEAAPQPKITTKVEKKKPTKNLDDVHPMPLPTPVGNKLGDEANKPKPKPKGKAEEKPKRDYLCIDGQNRIPLPIVPVPKPITKKVDKVKAAKEVFDIPQVTQVNFQQPQIMMLAPNEGPEIKPVTTFSRNAKRPDVPQIDEIKIAIRQEPTAARSRGAAPPVPFKLIQSAATPKFADMKHPLNFKRKNNRPTIRVKGTPSEW